MDRQHPFTTTEEERARRRAQRIAARKARQRAHRRRLLRRIIPAACLALVVVCGLLVWGQVSGDGGGDARASDQYSVSPSSQQEEETEFSLAAMLPQPDLEPLPEPKPVIYTAQAGPNTAALGTEINSEYAVLIDVEDQEILAQKEADAIINPASMTKVLTVLVASEHLKSEADLQDTVTIDLSITDYCYVNDCSVVGFLVDEKVPVKDLFYGTILPSGADAALGLANYIAGSQEAFVELMNEKLEELGLADTAHFTNCVGLYDEAHKCTVSDMAVILEAAMDNDLCREVLGARTYETLPTADHPEGQILSNWFLRRIEDKDTGGIEVTGAKTGYVVESGNCAASCGETADGRRYICVTADAYSSWRAIYDHVALYKTYCSPADDTTEDGGAADPLVEPVAPTIKDTTEHESGASL